MKLILQRVNSAAVIVNGVMIGKIGHGLLVFLGIGTNDNEKIADIYIEKLLKLRIFSDENGKTNLSIVDVVGELLVVSQFTLYADCKKGNRPSFINAGKPDLAKELYEYIIEQAKNYFEKVASGIFGADMEVELKNDGPFTIILDSKEIL